MDVQRHPWVGTVMGVGCPFDETRVYCEPKEKTLMQFEDPVGTLDNLSARIIALRDSL